MRDTATDYTTGWLRNGLYEREFDPLADGTFGGSEGFGGFEGLGELGQVARKLPALGQQYLKQALADPTTRDDAKKLLRAGGDALAEQAEKDAVEAAHPTGQKIIFKGFARDMGQKIVAAEEAMIDALPYKDTEEGHDALELARVADDPQQALSTYLTAIGLEAMTPEEDIFGEQSEGLFGDDDEDEALSRLEPYGLGMSAKGKKILKGVAIGVAVAAGVVLTGGVLLPALGAALPAVLGTVGTVAGAVFKPKGGGAVAQPQPGGDVTVVQQGPGGAPAAPQAPAAIEEAPGGYLPPQVQQQIAQMPPQQAYQQAYQSAMQAGAGDEQALAVAQHMQEQSEVVHGTRPPTAQAGMFGMDTNTLAIGAVVLFAVSQLGGGGGGSRRRRNPSYRYSGVRRKNPYAPGYFIKHRKTGEVWDWRRTKRQAERAIIEEGLGKGWYAKPDAPDRSHRKGYGAGELFRNPAGFWCVVCAKSFSTSFRLRQHNRNRH
jgi:hypothetical protein